MTVPPHVVGCGRKPWYDWPALRATVVIVEHGTARYLADCLQALERVQPPSHGFRVVVVDNGSPTPVDHIRRRFPWAHFIDTGRNLGFAGGCAAALPVCDGDVIVALNPDTEVEPGWLAGLLRPFDDPSVGVVGCKVFYPDSRVLQHAGGLIRSNGLTEHRGRGEPDVGQYDRVEDVDYVTGASLAVRRELVDRLGWFSTAYHPVYFEETEMCARVRASGHRVVYTPHAAVFHHEAVASGGSSSETFLERYHRNRVRFVVRNYRVRDILWRFVPAEVAFHASAGMSSLERRLCLRSYVLGLAPSRQRS